MPHFCAGDPGSNDLTDNPTHYNTLQHTATHCNTLQHTATHCNRLHTLQHTAATMFTERQICGVHVYECAYGELCEILYRSIVHIRCVAVRCSVYTHNTSIFEGALSLAHMHKFDLILSFFFLSGSHSLFQLFDLWTCVPHTYNQILCCFSVTPPPHNKHTHTRECSLFHARLSIFQHPPPFLLYSRRFFRSFPVFFDFLNV